MMVMEGCEGYDDSFFNDASLPDSLLDTNTSNDTLSIITESTIGTETLNGIASDFQDHQNIDNILGGLNTVSLLQMQYSLSVY